MKLLTYTEKAQDFPISESQDFGNEGQTKGLYKSQLVLEEQLNETALPANGTSNDLRNNHNMPKDAHEKAVADIKEKGNIV